MFEHGVPGIAAVAGSEDQDGIVMLDLAAFAVVVVRLVWSERSSLRHRPTIA